MNRLFILNFVKVSEALSSLTSYSLPIKTTLKLRKIIKMVEEEFKAFEDVRLSRLSSLAKKDENGNPVMVDKNFSLTKENELLLAKEISEYLKQEISFEKIDISEIEGVSLSIDQLTSLSPFLEGLD